MKKEKNNLISATELKKELNNKKIKILDARWFLEDSQKGKKLYDKQHIPQAIFFDINNLSDKTSDLPHMLPKKEIFKKYLDENGISKENEIIVYDQIGFFSSARVWFIFKYFSFDSLTRYLLGKNLSKIKSIRIIYSWSEFQVIERSFNYAIRKNCNHIKLVGLQFYINYDTYFSSRPDDIDYDMLSSPHKILVNGKYYLRNKKNVYK